MTVSNKDSAFEQSARRLQDKEHRWIANRIYRHVFGEVRIERFDEGPIDVEVQKALDILGIDFSLKFTNGTLLAGQEKFLSYNCKSFRTITISEHSWKHCAAQIYFCGYLTIDDQDFEPWVVLNWPSIIRATAQSQITWKLTLSRTSYPSFWSTAINVIPISCIIACNASR